MISYVFDECDSGGLIKLCLLSARFGLSAIYSVWPLGLMCNINCGKISSSFMMERFSTVSIRTARLVLHLGVVGMETNKYDSHSMIMKCQISKLSQTAGGAVPLIYSLTTVFKKS